jgi:hypothetical protein
MKTFIQTLKIKVQKAKGGSENESLILWRIRLEKEDEERSPSYITVQTQLQKVLLG